MNYEKLMGWNPMELGKMANSLGQEIVFYEHPILGDEAFIICACHKLKLAQDSDFLDLHDMVAEHGEYEPSFKDDALYIGEFKV